MTRAHLELFFEDEQADRRSWQSFEQIEKGHGRLERRQITTSPDLNDYLCRDWGEVGQVFRLQRERQSKEKSSVEGSMAGRVFRPSAAPLSVLPS